MEDNETQRNYLTFGYYSSFILSILTIITFGFAMTAIPPAGPYLDISEHADPFNPEQKLVIFE